MIPESVMTIEELAAYLRLPVPRLLGLAEAGGLPGEQADHQWRFHREVIDRWLADTAEDLHSLEQVAGTETAVGCVESSDIEEFEAMMAPWTIELDQYSRGSFTSKVQYTKLSGVTVYEANWRRAARTRGVSPEGVVTIGTNLAWRRAGNYWCGRPIGRRRFACAGPNTEYGHTSPDRSHHTAMLVERGLLAAAIGEDAVDRICRRKHLAFTATDGERLMAVMTGVVRTGQLFPARLNDPREAMQAQSWLLGTLAGCLKLLDAGEERESALQRKASVHRAIAYVDRSSVRLTALQLAIAAGATQRTLERGFREILGMTPATYLRRHRMNRAQHALAHADPRSTTVTEIALDWGFSHLGRFSVEYRDMFGDAPSRTLNHTLKTTPHQSLSRIVEPIQ